jgi:superfamily II DNA/RNA helicase
MRSKNGRVIIFGETKNTVKHLSNQITCVKCEALHGDVPQNVR